jgi:transposase-like protein
MAEEKRRYPACGKEYEIPPSMLQDRKWKCPHCGAEGVVSFEITFGDARSAAALKELERKLGLGT